MPITPDDVIASIGRDQIRDLPIRASGGIDAHAAADLWQEAIGTTAIWEQFLDALAQARKDIK
jgi:hypothetical protein